MTLFRTSLAALLLAVPLWLALTTPTYACSCAIESLVDKVERTDLIVIGVGSEPRFVVQPTSEPLSNPVDPARPEVVLADIEMDYSVNEYLKGVGPEELLLLTGFAYLEVTPDGEALSSAVRPPVTLRQMQTASHCSSCLEKGHATRLLSAALSTLRM
jgi:hypothetical protein